MTKHHIICFLLITVISSLALAITPINRQRKDCLTKTVPQLLKYPLNNTYCDYMILCNVPCNKDLIPPTGIQLFQPSSTPFVVGSLVARKSADSLNFKSMRTPDPSNILSTSSITYSNNYCSKGISFLRNTNSKSCDKLVNCPNIKCVSRTKRDVKKAAYAFIAFEAFACASSALLMASIEVGTAGLSTPALVTPAVLWAGTCGSVTTGSSFVAAVGELFDWW